jgi:hypothetical protein
MLDSRVLDNILSQEHRAGGLRLMETEDLAMLLKGCQLVASWPATRATLLAIHQAADRCLARDGIKEIEIGNDEGITFGLRGKVYDCTDCQFVRGPRYWTECSRDDEECHEWQGLVKKEYLCPAYVVRVSKSEFKASEAC